MKKTLFLAAVVAMLFAGLNSYGQELKRTYCRNGKFAFKDETGKFVTPCKYDNVDGIAEGLAPVKFNGKWGFVDEAGKEIIPYRYDSYWDRFREGLIRVELNDKWGFIDKTGKEVVPIKYDMEWWSGFHEGLAAVALNGKWGFIDKTGKEVIPFKYHDVWYFDEGLAEVRLNGKYGFIDKTGKEVVPHKYWTIHAFRDGLAGVRLDGGKYGFIDKTGKEVIPCKYDDVDIFYEGEGLAAVKLNGKWGFINKTGKEVISFKYDNASFFSEGLAAVALNGKWGFIDKTGREVIPFKYDDVSNGYYFSDGFARVKLNGEVVSIDKTGKEVILKYSGGGNSEPTRVVLNGKVGFIKRSYNSQTRSTIEIVPCKYDDGEDFSEGLAAVKLNGKWGFIDTTGKEVIPLKYDYAYYFREGLACVILNGKYGFIDKTGKEVISLKYDHVHFFYEGLAAVRLNWSYGFIDKTGQEVIPFAYADAGNFKDGLAEVKLGGKWGLIDNTDETVVPFEYPSEKEAAAEVKNMFSYFAKIYVEAKINGWQKKGKYEKTAEWQQRVTESTRNEMAKLFAKEAVQEFIKAKSKDIKLSLSLSSYDADNETYLVTGDMPPGKMLVHVPVGKAKNFENSWHSITYFPQFGIENDRIAIAAIDFQLPNGESYKYSNQASLNYAVAQIDYKFDPINIDIAPSTTPKGNQTVGTVCLSVGKSDVAENIPTTNVKNDKTFAVIIANENYQRESKVEFARNDGETLKKYCVQTLGLPEKNIHFVADATLNNIRGEISWLKQVADAYNGEASIIFYYAGHGIPDESSKTAYLLPIDGYGSDVQTGYKLDNLYQTLGKMPAKHITVFMDACFSGTQRSGDMLASARGVAIKVAQGAPVGNMVVFSAAQGDETAYPYKEKGHGMFTYFLLKKLQETKGNVTLGELGDYITANVRRESVVSNRKSQTPTVTPSSTLGFAWEDWKLR